VIKKISHIGMDGGNLDTARTFFRKNFGLASSEQENFGELIFSFISPRA